MKGKQKKQKIFQVIIKFAHGLAKHKIGSLSFYQFQFQISQLLSSSGLNPIYFPLS